jgi:hypothetical protein
MGADTGQMIATRATAFIAACALGWAGSAAACGDDLGYDTRRIESAHYAVVFKTVPDPIEVGTHFSLDFAVCPRGRRETARGTRRCAYARHRHGMNGRSFRARSRAYRADGFMFHMPGRWDLLFDVVTGGGSGA